MSFVESYKKFMEINSDPRTETWWLMSGPGPLLTILITYLYFCNSVGPRYMRDRKPYDLKHTIIAYNISQILFSIFLFYEGLMSGWWKEYNFSCQPVDYSDSPKAKRMAAAVWWYFFAKIVELLDTIFFVLRKKNRQITFLHLYHHSIMPVCAWIGVKFLPGGHGTLLGVINSFIHIIMYTYYLISGLGPEYQKYVWWKKHVTDLQLVQFCIIFYHNFSVMFRDCNYPKFINFLLTLNAMAFLYMFGKFYINSYLKNKNIKNGSICNGNGMTSYTNGVTNNRNSVTTNGISTISNSNGVFRDSKCISSFSDAAYESKAITNGCASSNGFITQNNIFCNGYSHIANDKRNDGRGHVANGNGISRQLNSVDKEERNNTKNGKLKDS